MKKYILPIIMLVAMFIEYIILVRIRFHSHPVIYVQTYLSILGIILIQSIMFIVAVRSNDIKYRKPFYLLYIVVSVVCLIIPAVFITKHI